MSASKSDLRPLRTAKAGWDDIVLVCRKCARGNPGGVDGEGTPLRKWLKRELKSRGAGKRFRVVKSSCLDLCPKKGVALARGSELAERRPLRVFRNGDDPQSLLEWLLRAEAASSDN